ncbi:hypothetical protein [Aeromonas veronii]|uniref:hypothetical protein n=1 Tax=Aeromonas veronii TaxID=654 RepID=UPI002936EFDC|nr:hypothetical protein [Aeromonas veronii]WOE87219.1 hypothetical protein RY930_23460 [Aeromonas veronii]
MICQENHRYDPFFDNLRVDQANPARHKCAGCAYELGYRQGKLGSVKNFQPGSLKRSQAGYVRHRAAEDAFELGYTQGERERLEEEDV